MADNMEKRSKMFCSAHHMLITTREDDKSGNQIGLCNLCRRERGISKPATKTKTGSERRHNNPENIIELYRKVDSFLSANPTMSNNSMAEALKVHNRTIAKRRVALGLGSSTAGKLSEDTARRILEIQRTEPGIPISTIARKAGCSRGSVSKVLTNPEHYADNDKTQ